MASICSAKHLLVAAIGGSRASLGGRTAGRGSEHFPVAAPSPAAAAEIDDYRDGQRPWSRCSGDRRYGARIGLDCRLLAPLPRMLPPLPRPLPLGLE